jgi:hypothetical protein
VVFGEAETISQGKEVKKAMMEKLQLFVQLEKRRKELEAEVKEIGKEIEALGVDNEHPGGLMDEMLEAGLTTAKVDGVTVYFDRKLWAGAADGDYDRACDALVAAGMSDYVQRRFNVNSMSAYVREMDKTEQPLPPEFAETITVVEKVKLRTRGR